MTSSTDYSVFAAWKRLPATRFEYSFKGNELAVSGIFINKIRALEDSCLKGRHLELSDPNSRLFQQYFDF